jgi:predicted HTH domain antitoxin
LKQTQAQWQAEHERRNNMSLTIPDEILQTTRMTAAELSQEIAVLLFQKEKLTLGQASRLAGMSQLQFQHLLASRQIPVHYDVAEFEEDLKTLQELKRQ